MVFNLFNVGNVGNVGNVDNSLLPHIPLGTFPTRVEKLEKIGERLGLHNLWVKRDDESGVPFGGNKVRKLEFVLADVKAKKKERLIVIGAKGSNSVLATAIYADQLGIKTIALLFDQYMNKRASENFEAIKRIVSEVYLLPRKNVGDVGNVGNVGNFILRAMSEHKEMYFVVPGCSSPLGVMGYIKAAFELKEQVEKGQLPEPNFIFLPLGTGGTAVGLSLGAKLAGLKSRIVAVRVVDKIVANSLSVKFLSLRVARLLKKLPTLPTFPNPKSQIPSPQFSIFHFLSLDNLEILEGCFGEGYGIPTEKAKEALGLMRSCEGIELDETYTAKAFAGLIKYAKENGIEHQPILFWNTFASRREE